MIIMIWISHDIPLIFPSNPRDICKIYADLLVTDNLRFFRRGGAGWKIPELNGKSCTHGCSIARFDWRADHEKSDGIP